MIGLEPRICPWCKAEFEPKRGTQRYCHAKCRDDWHNKEKMMALKVWRQGLRARRTQQEAAHG